MLRCGKTTLRRMRVAWRVATCLCLPWGKYSARRFLRSIFSIQLFGRNDNQAAITACFLVLLTINILTIQARQSCGSRHKAVNGKKSVIQHRKASHSFLIGATASENALLLRSARLHAIEEHGLHVSHNFVVAEVAVEPQKLNGRITGARVEGEQNHVLGQVRANFP